MEKWQDKTHPLMVISEQHKKSMKMVAESLNTITTRLIENAIITVKVDGEHTIMQWKINSNRLQKCETVNSYGTCRKNILPTKEFSELMSKLNYTEITVAGELYAVWDDGKKMFLKDVMHHIKSPIGKEENRIRFAVFDLISLNEKPVHGSYLSRLNLLTEIIGKNTKFVHIVVFKQGNESVINKMWDDEVIFKGAEGLVIHFGEEIIKVKMISTMDVVIIGMKKDGKRFNKKLAGALLPAFMTSNGIYVVSSNVGTGFNESEQKEWFDWIMNNSVGEMIVDGSPYIMCSPKRIVEIGANEWYFYNDKNPQCPAYKFNDSYYYVGMFPGIKGQKPRFVKNEFGNMKERFDKSVNAIDLRLTQCPDFKEEWLFPFINKCSITQKNLTGWV